MGAGCHSSHVNRKKVFEEVHRVLRPGGEFIFTDPMQKPGADAETLKPVLERIHLESMGSVECYGNYARELGMETIEVLQMPEQLVNHYSAVLHNLESRHDELKDVCDPAYLERIQNGLKHWIDAAKTMHSTGVYYISARRTPNVWQHCR